jgi:hypothetical protein
MGELYSAHTFVMIAERRAQLLEHAVQDLQSEVGRLHAAAGRQRTGPHYDDDDF